MSTRYCEWCGKQIGGSLGVSQQVQTTFFGGKTGYKIVYTGKQDLFFCTDEHRDNLLYRRPGMVSPVEEEAERILAEKYAEAADDED